MTDIFLFRSEEGVEVRIGDGVISATVPRSFPTRINPDRHTEHLADFHQLGIRGRGDSVEAACADLERHIVCHVAPSAVPILCQAGLELVEGDKKRIKREVRYSY